MFKSLIIAATVASTLAASTAQADHRGRGGRGSNFGIGIGGGGVSVYYGRGGGWNRGGWGGGWGGYGRNYYGGGWGGYGGGYYGGGYYPYSSGYYYPGYSSGYYYSTPSYSTTVIEPAVPAGPASPSFDGGAIVLTNPTTNSETVEYALNGQMFSMKPGQSQRFTHDRDWIIEFNKGIGVGRYGLKSSTYKFKRTANGWELFEQADSHPASGVAPPPPMNDPLRSAERLEPAEETQRIERRDTVPPPVPDEDQPRERDSDRNADDQVIRPRQVPQP